MKNSRALKMSLQKFSWFIESAYICIFEVILAWTGAKIYWNQNKVTYILNSNTVLCISSLAISKIWQRKQVPDRKIAGKTVGVSNFFDVSERKKKSTKSTKKTGFKHSQILRLNKLRKILDYVHSWKYAKEKEINWRHSGVYNADFEHSGHWSAFIVNFGLEIACSILWPDLTI